MRLAQVVVIDEQGNRVFKGTLRLFARANELAAADVATLAAELRAGLATRRGPPAPAIIGGGAAPAFFVSLARRGRR